MIKLVSTSLKAINVFVVAVYLLACLIPFLSDGTYTLIAVLGLVFPILTVLVVLFLAGWIIARSKWFLLSLIALLLSWKQLSVIMGLNQEEKFSLVKKDDNLRVLTWNLSSWDETSRMPVSSPNSFRQMSELVLSYNADVLCFQEFYDRNKDQSTFSAISLFKKSGYKYSYFVESRPESTVHRTGVAIFSKFPILDTARFNYGEMAMAEHLIYADIAFKDQKIRIITTHLQSVRFENKEYTTLNKLKHTKEIGIEGSRGILNKLGLAYYFRSFQADLLSRKIRESPYPVIVCGDFNDVPNSYTYFKVKGDLQDAFLEKGNKIGRTFRYISPTLRIDYILADKRLAVKQFNRIIAPYSDHYPVVTDLEISGPRPI